MTDDSKDLNATIAGLLRDLASVQKSKQKQWAYKRAALAVANLDEPIESVRPSRRHPREDSACWPLVDAR